jgi:hypothetical protein
MDCEARSGSARLAPGGGGELARQACAAGTNPSQPEIEDTLQVKRSMAWMTALIQHEFARLFAAEASLLKTDTSAGIFSWFSPK